MTHGSLKEHDCNATTHGPSKPFVPPGASRSRRDRKNGCARRGGFCVVGFSLFISMRFWQLYKGGLRGFLADSININAPKDEKSWRSGFRHQRVTLDSQRGGTKLLLEMDPDKKCLNDQVQTQVQKISPGLQWLALIGPPGNQTFSHGLNLSHNWCEEELWEFYQSNAAEEWWSPQPTGPRTPRGPPPRKSVTIFLRTVFLPESNRSVATKASQAWSSVIYWSLSSTLVRLSWKCKKASIFLFKSLRLVQSLSTLLSISTHNCAFPY